MCLIAVVVKKIPSVALGYMGFTANLVNAVSGPGLGCTIRAIRAILMMLGNLLVLCIMFICQWMELAIGLPRLPQSYWSTHAYSKHLGHPHQLQK